MCRAVSRGRRVALPLEEVLQEGCAVSGGVEGRLAMLTAVGMPCRGANGMLRGFDTVDGPLEHVGGASTGELPAAPGPTVALWRPPLGAEESRRTGLRAPRVNDSPTVRSLSS